MHPNFSFDVPHVLWTLTFAAQLVLLVVLLGRDRARRYPWFTAAIALSALELMAEVLLSGRMPMVNLQELMLTLADLTVIVNLLVLVEVARRAFSGVRRSQWIVNAAGLVVVAVGILAVWGQWPAWKELAWESLLDKLRLMNLAAQKGSLLVSLLTAGLGLLVVIFGRHFKAAWRSHTQMIAIGLSTVAISLMAAQGVVQYIVRSVHPHSRPEYDRIMALLGKVMYANKTVYIVALVWWIVWLWLDEPGTAAAETAPEALELPLAEEPPQAAE